MRRPPFPILALVTAAAGAAGMVALQHHAARQAEELQRAHVESLREQRAQWAVEFRDHQNEAQAETLKQQDDWQRAAADRREQSRREFETALGGPVAAVLKDPHLTLPDMIRELALINLTQGARAAVEVERFTEFNVVVAVPSLETRLVLADAARTLLEACAPYVHSLRFVYGTNLLAELNREQIESVQDWSLASRREALDLFRAAAERRLEPRVKQRERTATPRSDPPVMAAASPLRPSRLTLSGPGPLRLLQAIDPGSR